MSTFGREADAQWLRNKEGEVAEVIDLKSREPASKFTLVSIADVPPRAVDWTWPGYLAKGKLTLLGGDPDLGKSLVCIDAAATLSKGRKWPSGGVAKTGATLFICSEDGIADTIRPRAEAAEADLKLLHVFESMLINDGKRKSFNLRDDLDMLGAAIKQVGNASLVVIDAITSYMGAIDSHRTTDVRAVLEPIAGFAEGHGVSILGVTHPPKASFRMIDGPAAVRVFVLDYLRHGPEPVDDLFRAAWAQFSYTREALIDAIEGLGVVARKRPRNGVRVPARECLRHLVGRASACSPLRRHRSQRRHSRKSDALFDSPGKTLLLDREPPEPPRPPRRKEAIAAQGKCLAVLQHAAISCTSANPAHRLSRFSFSLKEQ